MLKWNIISNVNTELYHIGHVKVEYNL